MPPAIRGRQARQNLDALRELNPIAVQRITARLPEETRLIQAAGITDWIAIEGFVAVLDAAREELGEVAYRAYCSEAMQRALCGPLIHNLWDSAVHLFGLEPGSLLGWAPHVWSLVYRHSGSIAWSQHERTLVLEGAPPAASRSAAWVESIRGGIDAVHALCESVATCRIAVGPGGEIRYQVGSPDPARAAASAG